MHWWAQWWFVITRPSGDTKLPEQPPASRAEESRAASSHSGEGRKSYAFATRSAGKASNVHMPSSAPARRGAAARRARRIRFIGGLQGGQPAGTVARGG